MTGIEGGEAAGASASGPRSVAISGPNYGVVTTGDHSPVTQVSLGSLRPVGEVPAASGPVGVPGVGVFVGRGRELKALRAALSARGAVVVQAVAGLGGIGKSTLVAAYVLKHAGAFGQVVWVTADGAAGLEAGLARFAVALEPQLARVLPGEALAERATGWLATHAGWLLVLDNVAEPDLVRDLLPRLGAGRVVVTTRRAGGWAGIAQPLTLGVLDAGAARELVAMTVGAGRAGLLDGVDELCARLGFLPLALEQAAAYMAQNALCAREYLELWEAAPGEMYREGAEGTADERTVARVWEVSLEALAKDGPLAGTVLRVLAWLSPEGVPRSLLEGLGERREVLRAVGRLAAYSMLAVDDGGVITVHRLVQEMARTAQDGDPGRDPVLVAQARDDAARLLEAAVPGDPRDPGCWPRWRVLAAQVAAFAGHAPAHTDTESAAFALDRVGVFLRDQGSLSQAVAYLRRAIEGYERLRGPDGALSSRNNLAGAYLAAGQHRQAVELHERNLADRTRTRGPDHPKTLQSANNLANAYSAAGQHRRAVELHERTFADREQILGRDHPDTLDSANNLANAYQAFGDDWHAVQMHERILAAYERVLGTDHPSTLQSANDLANAYYMIGAFRRAARLHERTFADRERILGPDHPKTLQSGNNLAYAYGAAGQHRRAVELHERTLADHEQILGPDFPVSLTPRKNLASAYYAAWKFRRFAKRHERILANLEQILYDPEI